MHNGAYVDEAGGVVIPDMSPDPSSRHRRVWRLVVVGAVALACVVVLAAAYTHGPWPPDTAIRLHASASYSVRAGFVRLLVAAHGVVAAVPRMPASVLVAWRGAVEAAHPPSRPARELLPAGHSDAFDGGGWRQPVTSANATGGRQLAQMGRCITQCSPSAMQSVNMPFCGEVVDFFTCPGWSRGPLSLWLPPVH